MMTTTIANNTQVLFRVKSHINCHKLNEQAMYVKGKKPAKTK